MFIQDSEILANFSMIGFHDMGASYLKSSEKMNSNCCGAPIVEPSGLCSKCKEHCSIKKG